MEQVVHCRHCHLAVAWPNGETQCWRPECPFANQANRLMRALRLGRAADEEWARMWNAVDQSYWGVSS
jgi:hypothetical protein